MSDSSADIHLPPIALLQLLADGELHSGRELANVLGVSRTAIWKQLAKLEPLGLELQSQPGKGYCLPGGLDLLEQSKIRLGLLPQVDAAINNFDLFDVLDSTNAWLIRQESQPGVSVCIAECQTAGRGRRGRQWVSPFAHNVYMSLRMTVETGFGVLEGLSLAIGVTVADALGELGVDDIKLKWPNDILWRGRKLGGVLIEAAGDPSGRCHVVIGLGLNLKAQASMVKDIDQPWVALDSILPAPLARNKAVATLLNHIVPLLENYERQGFKPYKLKWEALNAHLNQQVSIQTGLSQTTGLVCGVNESGGLMLATEQGVQTFHGGEVSLRAEA
ncbi:MAG: bifunctional biotin--[acetyl-CoA-carboxylase] ligase/biotin operon repressor BirA [Cellvibrio sp.]